MQIIELQPSDFQDDRPWLTPLLTLYREAFPAAERHPEGLVIDRLHRGRERAIVGVSDDRLVMMALLWPLGEIGAGSASPLRAVLLDYFATASQVRGQGLGAIALDYLARRCGDRDEWLILEVEDPDNAPNAAERELCDRRMGFYRRAGAQFLSPLPYRLPPLNETNLTTPMQLGILPGWPQKTFPAAIARDLVATLYRQLCDRGLDDPYLQSFIGQIRDPIQLI
jgi:GNAT superfamily N-acetyltransferase